ncbi:hypothetical protein C1645_781194, partial [Glomus cerebriforme]
IVYLYIIKSIGLFPQFFFSFIFISNLYFYILFLTNSISLFLGPLVLLVLQLRFSYFLLYILFHISFFTILFHFFLDLLILSVLQLIKVCFLFFIYFFFIISILYFISY